MMKIFLGAAALILLFAGCNSGEQKVKNYTPRTLSKNETFNYFPADASDSISLFKFKKPGEDEFLAVKFRDSAVLIQEGKPDPGKLLYKFVSAQFINKQKTCLLVQAEDSSALVPHIFLIAVNKGALEVISLSRPSNGKDDESFSGGIEKVGATGYLVNNDFFITNVTANVYLIKRQFPQERIQGKILLLSPDKRTIIFTVKDFFYQVNYRTDEVVSEPIAADSPKDIGAVYKWIMNNYSYKQNKSGNIFLRHNDDNRIVNMSEFKK